MSCTIVTRGTHHKSDQVLWWQWCFSCETENAKEKKKNTTTEDTSFKTYPRKPVFLLPKYFLFAQTSPFNWTSPFMRERRQKRTRRGPCTCRQTKEGALWCSHLLSSSQVRVHVEETRQTSHSGSAPSVCL